MDGNQVVAHRILTATVEGKRIQVEVRVFMPICLSGGENWECAYEIAWAARRRRNSVGGLDSVQALFLALQFIGAELYAGRPAELAGLTWLEPGQGYGFLLPPNLRDLAVGEDKML
jgi:hypothetical protein